MTVSRKIDAYPTVFAHIAAKGSQCREKFSITFATEGAAISWRMQWYGYLKALDVLARELGPDKDDDGNLIDNSTALQARSGRGLMLSVNGTELLFTPREITLASNYGDEVLIKIDDILTRQEAESTAWIAERKQKRQKKQATTAKDRTVLAQAGKAAEIEGEEDPADRAARIAKL